MYKNEDCNQALFKIHYDFNIILPFGKIVGHCILLIVNIGNPVIRVHVCKIEQIQHFGIDPDIFEMTEERTLHDFIVARSQYARSSDIETTICRRTEGGFKLRIAWRTLRQSVRPHTSQLHLIS